MNLNGKTALVTGATGFLGGALALQLAKDNVRVRALARSPQKGMFLRERNNIDIVEGDITNNIQMCEVTEGCDYVFHVAAALSGNFKHQRKVNVEGTCSVMEAAVQAKIERIVYVSSIAVYGYRYTGDITEELPSNPNRDPYNITKAEAEAVVREVAMLHNLSYSVIRPGMIYGPNSTMWTRRMFLLAKRKPTLFIGDGSSSAYPIHVGDVVELMITLATHPAADGEVFNCTPDPSPTWREYLGALSRLAGHDSWLAFPVWPVRYAAPLIELVLQMRDQPKDLPDLLPFSQQYNTYKMTKARELLDWQPKIALQSGVESCVPWLREQGLLN